MSSDRELKLEAARAKFHKLSAPDSAVRRLSEATRDNDADSYNPMATMNAFDRTLKKSVLRLGEIAERLTRTK